MFNSELCDSNRAKRTRARNEPGRRLHVERMERRLMLSASSPQLMQSSAAVDAVPALNMPTEQSSGQYSIVLITSDGGFLDVGPVTNSMDGYNVGSGIAVSAPAGSPI